jgi:hypothetical protein
MRAWVRFRGFTMTEDKRQKTNKHDRDKSRDLKTKATTNETTKTTNYYTSAVMAETIQRKANML